MRDDRSPWPKARPLPDRYVVERKESGVECFAEYPGGPPLPGRRIRRERVGHVIYHSPTGLEYGYAGSGPADLALSILGHWYGCNPLALSRKIRAGLRFGDREGDGFDDEERTAAQYHQEFKFRFVAPADQKESSLVIGRAAITNFIADQIARERGVRR